MAITNAADGFTDYQSSGTTYYVASNGSNANAGTSEAAPFATIAHAYSQATGGTGARILLKRGQTFSLADLAWVKSGASSTDFMVLGAYGPLTDDRPIVNVGGSQGIAVHNTTLRYVAFQSIDFRSTSGGQYALSYLFVNQGASKALEHIHVEDCRFFQFYRGMRWQTDEPTGGVIPANPTPATNCRLKRNVFELCDIGFYSSMLHTADVHENEYLGCGSNYQEHGCYFDDSRYTGSQPDIDYRRNIAMGDNRGCGEGHKIRCVSNAGAVVDNFAARCGIGIAVGSGGETNGGGTGMDPWYALRVNLTDNWVTEGVNQKNFDGSVKPMGQGIWLIWLSGTSSEVQRNIVTDMGGNYRAGITFTNGPSNGVNVSNNTLFQSGGSGGAALYSLQNGTTLTNITVSSNRLRDSVNTPLIAQDVPGTFTPTVRGGNTFFNSTGSNMVVNAGTVAQYGTVVASIGINLSGAKPTITTFLASIGIIGDYTTLRNMLALQRRGNWDTRIEATRINDHARAWAGYPALATGAANVPPTANAGSDATATDTDLDADVVATLDLTGSTDGDGTISTYIVREGPTVLYSGSDSTPDVTLTLGLHTLSVTCVDDDGATSNPDTVVITGKPGVLTTPGDTPSVESTTLSVAAYAGVTYEWRWGLSTGAYGSVIGTTEPFLNVGEVGDAVTVYWQARATAGGVPGDWITEQTATTGAAVALAPTAVILTPAKAQIDLDGDGVLDVRLDGSVSSDPDGTVEAWTWFEDPGSPISTSESSLVPLSIGRHVISLIVTDDDTNDSIPAIGTFDVQPTNPTGVGSTPRSGAATLFVQSYPRATGYRFQYGATSALGTTVDSAVPSIDIAATGKVYWKAAVLAGPIIGAYTSIQETVPIVTELHPPIANAGSDITDTDTDNNGFESVTLDGSGSTDNGNDIVGWYWAENGTVLSIDSETYALNAPVGVSAYTLTVIDSNGSISADSDEVTVSVTPAQVTSLTLVPGDSRLVAAWETVNGEGVTYEIQANENSDFSGDPAAETTSTFNGAAIEGLVNDTLYYVRVRAVCDGLNGAWSTGQSETPLERDDPTPPSKTFYGRKERLFRLLRIGRL